MLTELEVKNFKAFKDFHAKGFKRLNLIGGRNNSGKTTFLEAIFFPFDLKNNVFIFNHWLRRQASALTVNIPVTMSHLFLTLFYQQDKEKNVSITTNFHYQTPKKFTFSMDWKQKSGENINVIVNPEGIKAQSSYHTQNEALDEVFLSLTSNNNDKQTLVCGITPNGSFNHNLHNPLETPQLVIINTSREANQPPLLGKIITEGHEDEFIKIIQEVIEPKIEAIRTVNSGGISQIYVKMEDMQRLLPVSSLGEGTNSVMHILMQMFSYPNCVILIDEIDSGLHYSVIERFWATLQEMAEKFNCQIFAVTHSDECLTAFSKLKGEDHAYIRLSEADNKIHAQLFDAEALNGAREMNLEMR